MYDRQQILPTQRSTLYGQALDILLSEWSAQKRLEHDPIYEGFHPGLEKVLLAQIAYESFEQDQLFFLKDDITRRIGEFLADTLDAPKYLDGAAVLRAIERQQGILVERATDIYSFSHLTLQEYLTAFHIKEEGLETELIAHHLTDKRWREVFLLVAGLMGNKAINFLAAIEAASRTRVAQHPKIIALIQWAATSTAGATSSLKLLSQRASAIAIASASASVRANARARARARAGAEASALAIASASTIINAIASARAITIASDIDNKFDGDIDIPDTTSVDINIYDFNVFDIAIASAIASNIASDSDITITLLIGVTDSIDIDSVIAGDGSIFAQIFSSSKFVELPNQLQRMAKTLPDDSASSEAWQTWADELEALWLNALSLTQEDLTFGEAEAKALQNYFYAIELLLRCKDAAIRIPKQAWAELEDCLLIYPS